VPFCAPQLVFSKTWLAQTAAISNANIFTLAQTGVYRVTISLRGPSQTTSNNTLLANVGWIQEYSGVAESLQSNINTINFGDVFSRTNYTVDTITSGPVSLITSFSSGLTFSYDVSVAIEQLA